MTYGEEGVLEVKGRPNASVERLPLLLMSGGLRVHMSARRSAILTEVSVILLSSWREMLIK
jgi:hypothetical protein